MDSDPPLSRASRRDFIIAFLASGTASCDDRLRLGPEAPRVVVSPIVIAYDYGDGRGGWGAVWP